MDPQSAPVLSHSHCPFSLEKLLHYNLVYYRFLILLCGDIMCICEYLYDTQLVCFLKLFWGFIQNLLWLEFALLLDSIDTNDCYISSAQILRILGTLGTQFENFPAFSFSLFPRERYCQLSHLIVPIALIDS